MSLCLIKASGNKCKKKEQAEANVKKKKIKGRSYMEVTFSGCAGRMVSASDSQPQDGGFESRVKEKCPAWATGGDNGASVRK